MSAAPKCLPVAVGELPQAFPMAQYPRLFKEEVLDPGYAAGLAAAAAASAAAASAAASVPPLTNSSSPALPNGPAPGNKALEKVKRTYTRKTNSGPKAKKVKTEPVAPAEPNATTNGATQSQIGDHMPVQKRKRDRFKGTTEEEVLTRVLPDHVREDLDILIVGINPGLTAAYVQHHYAGPGNHFWKCLYLSGMIPEPMNALQDAELLNYGIGFTNIVARTTRGSADLSRKEIFEGGIILKEKMLKFLPKIALFNGKGIYEVFCGHKNFNFGLQPDPFPGCPDTCVFVNPSSSARCTQLPRAVDKVPFFEALKRVRDHIRVHGKIDGIDRTTVTFPDFKLVTAPQKAKKEVKEEPQDSNAPSAPIDGERVPTSGTLPTEGRHPVPPTPKATKPKKPRGRPKREKPVATTQTAAVAGAATDTRAATAASTPISAAPMLSNEIHSNSQTGPPQAFINSNLESDRLADNAVKQPVHNGQLNSADFTVKREIVDAGHHDKDLAAIIQQSFNVRQSMFQQQQQSMAAAASSISATNPGLMMPASSSSAVKQERPDWNGYGVMPAYTASAPTTTAGYPHPQYSCYWNYLPTTSSFMTNGFNPIPVPQIAHQQAVAAAAALHTSVTISQANATPAVAAPPAVSYNSPQEASSPAMSSQSNLTQASLDSLPKADSASTVANWLQSIPPH